MPARLPLRLALSALTVLGLLLAGVPSATADAVPARLALAAPAAVHAGSPAAFTTTVTDASQAPVPGVVVVLQQKTGSSTWAARSHGTTDSTGKVTLPHSVTAGTTTWRSVYGSGTGQLVSDEASVVGQVLATTLTLTAPTSVVDEHSITLGLRWVASDGSPVAGTVRVQRRIGSGAWTAYRTVRTAANGQVRLTSTPRVDMRFRAIGSAGTWWRSDASAVRLVDNRPPGTPVQLPSAAPKPHYIAPNARATGAGAHVVVTTIPNSVWSSMVGRTWHSGCPVGRSGLRLLRVNYWGFDGYRYRGEMVVATAVAQRAGAAFADMYAGKYPLRRMFREDRFGWSKRVHGANDYASMAADNTSGFNCRSVVNKPSTLSPHARGRAIDINTWENPYRSATGLVPDAWWASHSHPRVAWRSSSHPVVKIWRKHGFHWTYANVDSQHMDGRRTATVTMGGFSG